VTQRGQSDVNVDLETFDLSQGKPAVQIFAAVRRWPAEPPELAQPELLDKAWMVIAANGFQVGERVMLTGAELIDFGAFCTRFGEALLERAREAGS
jgi:hypothetical protein